MAGLSDEEKLVQGLSFVRDEFIRTREILQLSIRKDIVAVELKDILANTKDYISLKSEIEKYIESLFEEYNKSSKKEKGENNVGEYGESHEEGSL